MNEVPLLAELAVSGCAHRLLVGPLFESSHAIINVAKHFM